MTTESPGPSRPSRVGSALRALAALLFALTLAACASTTGNQSGSTPPSAAASGDGTPEVTAKTVDQQALSATIKKALLADVPAASLDPVVADALAVASQPLTAEQDALLTTCLQAPSCDTGRGSLTVAFANDTTNPYRNIFRAELTAQAIAYPQVKKVIYANANDNVGAMNANLRSLIAQRVDVIILDSVYGPSILQAVQQAKQAGITVIQVDVPLPKEVAGLADTQVPTPLCQIFTDGAQSLTKEAGKASTYGLYTGIPGNANAAAWYPCAEQALQAQGWTKSTEGFTQWTPQGSAQAANALLASGQNPGAIVYDYTPDDFLKSYIAQGKTPPAVLSDAVNYSFLNQFKQAKDAGLNPKAIVCTSPVWYGRMGVTAAMKIRNGQQLAKEIAIKVPMVAVDDSLLALNTPDIPANVPFPSLLTATQMQTALTVS